MYLSVFSISIIIPFYLHTHVQSTKKRLLGWCIGPLQNGWNVCSRPVHECRSLDVRSYRIWKLEKAWSDERKWMVSVYKVYRNRLSCKLTQVVVNDFQWLWKECEQTKYIYLLMSIERGMNELSLVHNFLPLFQFFRKISYTCPVKQSSRHTTCEN